MARPGLWVVKMIENCADR